MGLTTQSISLMQRVVGTTPDGIMGPKTMAAVDGATDSALSLEQQFATLTDLQLDDYGNPDWMIPIKESLGTYVSTPDNGPVPGVAGSFTPMGVMIHHTAGPVGRDLNNDYSAIERFSEGRSGLSGPLMNGCVARDGTYWAITNGRSHHAGKGDGAVRAAMLIGGSQLPRVDNEYGNGWFYGLEIDHSGNRDEPWPEVQLVTAAKVCIIWLKAMGLDAGSVIGHREWTRRKVDPAYDMTKFRGLVARLMAGEESSKDQRAGTFTDLYAVVDGVECPVYRRPS